MKYRKLGKTGVHVSEVAGASGPQDGAARPANLAPPGDLKSLYVLDDAPTCAACGSIMVRSGACYRCMNCGETSGCS